MILAALRHNLCSVVYWRDGCDQEFEPSSFAPFYIPAPAARGLAFLFTVAPVLDSAGGVVSTCPRNCYVRNTPTTSAARRN
eukprot:scaffold984_cov144-Skeletonema_marinoi.AAC.14